MLKKINFRWMSLKIKTRLSIVISFHFVLISILIFIGIWYFLKHNYRELIFAQQQELVKSIADFIDTEIQDAQEYLISISKQMPVDKINDEDYIQEFIVNFPKKHPGVDMFFDRGIFILSKTGKLIGEYPYVTSVHGNDYSYREYFINTVKTLKPYISEPYLGTREPAKPIIQFTVPFFDKNNNFTGMILGAISLEKDQILNKLSKIKVGGNGYFYMFNKQRVMIYHPDQSRILKQYVPVGVNIIYDRAIDGFEGSMEITNSRGKKFLTTVKRLKTTGWILASNYPKDEAYARLRKILLYIFIFIIFISAVSISMIWLLMYFQLNPLTKLNNAIADMGKDIFAVNKISEYSRDEIGILTKSFNEMLHTIQIKTKEIHSVNETLYKLSTIDPLTELYNRRHIEKILQAEIERAKRYKNPLSLLILDLDFFKNINDNYGHLTGDKILKQTADIILKSIRNCDIAGRIGGEEFIVILPATPIENSVFISERIRKTIEESVYNDKIKYTCSIGAGAYIDETYDLFLTKVDDLLYVAKRTGRNKVITEEK